MQALRTRDYRNMLRRALTRSRLCANVMQSDLTYLNSYSQRLTAGNVKDTGHCVNAFPHRDRAHETAEPAIAVRRYSGLARY